jgi:hypothetical protein
MLETFVLLIDSHWGNYEYLHFMHDGAPSHHVLAVCMWFHNNFTAPMTHIYLARNNDKNVTIGCLHATGSSY